MALLSLNIDLTKTTHYFMHIAILGSETDSSSFNDSLLVPYYGIHIPRTHIRVCVRVCVRAFMLYALNFDKYIFVETARVSA